MHVPAAGRPREDGRARPSEAGLPDDANPATTRGRDGRASERVGPRRRPLRPSEDEENGCACRLWRDSGRISGLAHLLAVRLLRGPPGGRVGLQPLLFGRTLSFHTRVRATRAISANRPTTKDPRGRRGRHCRGRGLSLTRATSRPRCGATRPGCAPRTTPRSPDLVDIDHAPRRSRASKRFDEVEPHSPPPATPGFKAGPAERSSQVTDETMMLLLERTSGRDPGSCATRTERLLGAPRFLVIQTPSGLRQTSRTARALPRSPAGRRSTDLGLLRAKDQVLPSSPGHEWSCARTAVEAAGRFARRHDHRDFVTTYSCTAGAGPVALLATRRRGRGAAEPHRY